HHTPLVFTSRMYIYFFFLLNPPPPTSTLFPYTTLFRSLPISNCYGTIILSVSPVTLCFVISAARMGRGSSTTQASFETPFRSTGDRKSTRLNSSHVKISYAVFCLKKKKKKIIK